MGSNRCKADLHGIGEGMRYTFTRVERNVALVCVGPLAIDVGLVVDASEG